MKKVALSFLGLFAVAAIMTSCSRYEEGPGFTLLSKKARFSGEWSVSNVTLNGTDITSQFLPSGTTYSFVTEKDGTWTTTISASGFNSTGTGTWELYEDDVIIVTNGSADTDGDTTQILQLKNKEMKTTDTDSNGDVTIITYTQD